MGWKNHDETLGLPSTLGQRYAVYPGCGSVAFDRCVRRVRKPGTKFDEMLTSVVGEGKDKSTALEFSP